MRRGAGLAMVAALCLLVGCNRLPDSTPIAEVNEPSFEEGKRLLLQGKEQQALSAFIRVIDSRPDGAPESHLEVGLLYQNKIKDPIAAIYHFRRYLELKPNSPQADLVRGRIDASTRDFAATLPARPLEQQMMRSDLLDVVEKLRNENMRLKDEITALRPGATAGNQLSARQPLVTADLGNTAPTAEGMSGITRVPLEPVAPTQTQTAGVLAPPTRPGEAGNVRVHTVVKGDTLSQLSRRYYNTPTRFRDIYQANRDKMSSENDLKIGMQLVIPR